MAKKKKQSAAARTGGAIPMSPARFMREKARTLPVGKCYIMRDWQKKADVVAVVTRRRGSGNIVMCSFLVDTCCMGIKDLDLSVNMTPEQWEEKLAELQEFFGLEEVGYAVVHNFLLTALDFAEEGGIEPPEPWEIAQYILDDDTDDIPMIDFRFGVEGKHVLYPTSYAVTPDMIRKMRDNLGTDFVNLAGDEHTKGITTWLDEEEARHPHEPYIDPGDFPEPPPTDIIAHPDIIEKLSKIDELPPEELTEQIDEIIVHDSDSLMSDFNIALLNEIALTRYENEEMNFRPLLFNIIFAAIEHATDQLAPAMEQLLLMDDDFYDYHFGTVPAELLPTLLARVFADAPERLEAIICRKGLVEIARVCAMSGLALIPQVNPDRRESIRNFFVRLLEEAPEKVKNLDALDAHSAGFLLCELLDFGCDEELHRLGMRLFELDLIDRGIIDPGSFRVGLRCENQLKTRQALLGSLEVE